VVDEEYIEPTNTQLASFVKVYAQSIPEFRGVVLHESMLEGMMDRHPEFREAALRHHRGFQNQIHELTRKMQAGELQCEHILLSGKRCPNRNEPGRMYCGLHKEEDEGEPSREDA
jgi:hypothetical protein